MSYSTSEDFLLIKNLSTDTILTNLLQKVKILTDVNNKSQEHKQYIDLYISNLLKLSIIQVTINDIFTDNILYYYTKSNDIPDNYIIDSSKNNLHSVIDIDTSYYANDDIKKYMFIYDFLSEYTRNLSNIIKDHHVIDNNSLYDHEFNIRVRYIIKTTLQSTSTIHNVYNDNKSIYYYIVKFKLKDYETNKNKDGILIQPTNIDLDTLKIKKTDYPHNENSILKDLESETDNIYINSFKFLLNELIKEKDFTINNEDGYYHLIAKSYKYEFDKLLLNYFILKIIYFYFQTNYKTKVKTINDILTIDYPQIFINFNKRINEETNFSLIKIMKNSQKKNFAETDEFKNEIKLIRQKIIRDFNQREKLLKEVQDDIKSDTPKMSQAIKDAKGQEIKVLQENIDENNLKIKESLKNRYISNDASQIQEAIKYKQKLKDINDTIKEKNIDIKRFNSEINYEKTYMNNMGIVIYFVIFLLIVLVFTFILDYSTSSVNISIPIVLLIISIISYFLINYLVKNKFHNKFDGDDVKNNYVLNSFYNNFGGKYIEGFFESPTDNPIETENPYEGLNPIVQSALSSHIIGDNTHITNIDTYIDTQISRDINYAVHIEIPNSSLGDSKGNKALNLLQKTIVNKNDTSNSQNADVYQYNRLSTNSQGTSSNNWNNWHQQANGQDINIFGKVESTGEKYFVSLVHNNNLSDDYTKYTLHIPDNVKQAINMELLLIGGGSFGGNVITEEELQTSTSGLPPPTNMGEGGAGGAVIRFTYPFLSGDYEIGVGRGGSWQTMPGSDIIDLSESINSGQAKDSYIKNLITGDYIALAKGAEYIQLNSDGNNSNQQISGGKISGNIIPSGGTLLNGSSTISSVTNFASDGGRGGMIRPQEGQRGWSQIHELGISIDKYYLGDKRFELTTDTSNNTGTDGAEGVDVTGDFGTRIYNNGKFAAGGGASTYCVDGEVDSSGKPNFYSVSDEQGNNMYYTCAGDTPNRFGMGGTGGGGNGNSMSIGNDAMHSTGSGGGGGKTSGGSGGSGIVILKFDHEDTTTKINKHISEIKEDLKKTILETTAASTAVALAQQRANFGRLIQQINAEKALIAQKYGMAAELLGSVNSADETIIGYQETIAEVEAAQQALKERIEKLNQDITIFNQQIATVESSGDLDRAEIAQIDLDFQREQEEHETREQSIHDNEVAQVEKDEAIAKAKLELMNTVAIRLKADACNKALRAATTYKQRKTLECRKLERFEKAKLLQEARAAEAAALAEVLEAERLRDQALDDQYKAEQEYKDKKAALIELLNKPIPENEKTYILNLRLEIDYSIAGIKDYSEELLQHLTDDRQKTLLRNSLIKESNKRQIFEENIITELITSLSEYFIDSEYKTGILSNRFGILRISSGNLELRSAVETDEQKSEREKNEALFDFEKSLYVNEFSKIDSEDSLFSFWGTGEGFKNYSSFKVTEHFSTPAQTRRMSYQEPNNVTIIELEIYPNPKMDKRPYALDILTEIIKQSKNLSSPLRSSTRYLRYINAYKIGRLEEEWIGVALDRGIISDSSILQENIRLIDNIIMNFNRIKGLHVDLPSYYDNVNPLLKKEVREYKEKEQGVKFYNKLSETSRNVRLYDIRYKEILYNYIIILCVLISTFMIFFKFINNVLLFIIFIIIFIIITILYSIKLIEIMRTRYNKNYWNKPKKKLSNI